MQHVADINDGSVHVMYVQLLSRFYRKKYLKNLRTTDVWWKVLNCSCRRLMVSDL